LEFEYVFIPGLGAMPDADANSSEEARLLYVAMTRATEHLVGTYVGRSAFVEKWAQCLSA
jgi:superfamily I DNA/RNA helicase